MIRTAFRVGAVGIEMGVAVLIGYLGGNWLDERFDIAPICGLIGLGLGIGAAGKALWNTTRRVRRDEID